MAAEEKIGSTGTERVHLKRRIKLYQAIAMIAATMVGSAIYLSPGNVLEGAGSPAAAVAMWLVAGLLCLLGALTYAELATTYPGSGESLQYLNKFYGPFLSFNYSWMYLIFLRPAANAVKAITFGKYLLQLAFPDCALPHTAVKLFAIILVVAVAALNVVNVEAANKTHSFVTALSALSLVFFSVIGVVYLGQGRFEGWNTETVEYTSDPGRIVLTLYVALFAYAGWNSLNFIVEEVQKPYKNAPRAIITAVSAVIVLYVLVNVAYITVLGSQVMIKSEAVAVTFGQKAFPVVSWLVPVIVCIAQMSSYNSANILGTRILYAAARKGFFPSSLTLITTWSLSPVMTFVFQTIMVSIYVLVYDVYSLMRNVMFIVALYEVLVLLGLLRERLRRPHLIRPVKIPLVIPALYSLINVFLLLIPLVTRPSEAVIGALFSFGTGIPIYLVFIVYKWRHPRLNEIHRYATCLVQKIFLCVPEENLGTRNIKPIERVIG